MRPGRSLAIRLQDLNEIPLDKTVNETYNNRDLRGRVRLVCPVKTSLFPTGGRVRRRVPCIEPASRKVDPVQVTDSARRG